MGKLCFMLHPWSFWIISLFLIPPPRRNRHRYHGVLAPNATLRQAVKTYARLALGDESVSADQASVADEDLSEVGSKTPFYAASLWAMLIARIYEVFPLVCPQCGDELKIDAFLTEADPIQRILNHIGEPVTPPQIALARGPPD
ncbi:MAG: hypothetical protein Q8R93_08680 [Methylicorpusculum sp.]|nr:hypothetical protein [Methylicorpusculum sp.]